MVHASPLPRLDKSRVRRAFNRAATDYDASAVLQKAVGEHLLERLAYIRLAPRQVVDLGCGTGRISRGLVRHYRGARIISIDLADEMLRFARRRRRWRWRSRQGFICGDAEALPLVSGQADLVVSNLTLQWCNDPERSFSEVRRVLRPGGLFMFTTFGPDTLKELRQAWQGIDAFDHVHHFLDMHDIGDALVRGGFNDPVMDREDYTLTYADIHAVMHDLKSIGAHNAAQGRPRGLMGKQRLQQVARHYEQFRSAGRLPATFEVVHGHCWSPTGPGAQQRHADGSIGVPLTQLRRGTPP